VDKSNFKKTSRVPAKGWGAPGLKIILKTWLIDVAVAITIISRFFDPPVEI